MLVEEIMTRNVVKIDYNKSVYDACKIYKDKKVGCLVVIDKDMIVGIVTERDMIERVILENRNPQDTSIMDIMSPNIRTVHALAPLEKAAKIMKENNIKKLPVILNNEIVGIITETDLTKTIDAFSDAVEELSSFFSESKNSIEKIMGEWEDIICSLKGYKKMSEDKEKESFKK